MDELGATLVQNNSWSGSTIGYTGYNGADSSTSASFIYRLGRLVDEGFFEKNEIDTVLVFGGTNDSWCNAPLGEMSFREHTRDELYSVLPAICHFAGQVRAAAPTADILFIVNDGLKPEVEGALICAAEHYGMPYLKIGGAEKVNGHPTELGMKAIKEQVKAALLAL